MGAHATLCTLVRDHWLGDATLSATLPSGLYLDAVPPTVEGYPRGVLAQAEGGGVTYDTGVAIERVRLDLVVWTIGFAAADAAADAIKSRFDNAYLGEVGGQPILSCRRPEPAFHELVDVESDVWSVTVTYDVEYVS